MNNLMLILVIAIVLVAALAVWLYLDRRRRTHLRTRFGPEYDRVVQHAGDVRKAEAALDTRERRVAKYEIRPLSYEQSQTFGDRWRRVQAKFVDDPAAAITEADTLVTEVMTSRGYPMANFDRRAEDLSVDHPIVIANYRQAREIAVRHSRKAASTEELRQAIVHYRALFNDLLEVREPERRRA